MRCINLLLTLTLKVTFMSAREVLILHCSHWRRQGGPGGPAPQWPGKKERKGVFLSDVRHLTDDGR